MRARLRLWLLNVGVTLVIFSVSSALGAIAIASRIMERIQDRKFRKLMDERKSWLDD